MKKLVMLALSTLTSGIVCALPVGNPSDPSLLSDGIFCEGKGCDPCDPCTTFWDCISFRAGFYGDYVFNRHMRIERRRGQSIEHTKVITNAGLLVWNFYDRFDLFATLGETNIEIETGVKNSFTAAGTPFGRIVLETSSAFSYSVGARVSIWEVGNTTLGAEGQYFYSRPNVSRLEEAALAAVYPNKLDVRYREWQVGAGISHRINMFVPYIAIKGGRTRIMGERGVLPNFINNKSWGYAVGVTLIGCERVSLTAEGRFADEKALHVNGQIRF